MNNKTDDPSYTGPTGFDWQYQARAAGWSPPVKSRLRAIEGGHGAFKVVTRPLTQEEVVEVGEHYITLFCPHGYTLSSGVRVVLKEE